MELNELIKKNNQEPDFAEDAKILDEGAIKETLISEGNVIQLVSFLLDDVEYGIDILAVHEILRISDVTRLPNTPSYIRGVINLRGNVIPVVDVRERFGLKRAKLTDLSRIIVVEIGEKLVGLLVDIVHQVVRMQEKNIDPPSELIEGISNEFINGIGHLSSRLIVILNLGSMLFSSSEEEKKII